MLLADMFDVLMLNNVAVVPLMLEAVRLETVAAVITTFSKTAFDDAKLQKLAFEPERVWITPVVDVTLLEMRLLVVINGDVIDTVDPMFDAEIPFATSACKVLDWAVKLLNAALEPYNDTIAVLDAVRFMMLAFTPVRFEEYIFEAVIL